MGWLLSRIKPVYVDSLSVLEGIALASDPIF
jgi:hypothetical protein